MSIANELSSEVAAAMLANQKDRDFNPNELLNVVLEVHTTLRRLTNESRRKSLRSPSDTQPTRGASAIGN